MGKNNSKVPGGAKQNIYSYSLYDSFNIKKSNLFWKVVDFFTSKMDKLGKIYEKSISKEYDRESKLFDISNSHDILHIGCGSYPVTAIALSKNNGSNIVGIDRNSKSVERAVKIIKKMDLQNKVRVVCGDGKSYPVDKFDTIIISACSVPKKPILENIFKNARKDSKIIVREIYGANKLISDLVDIYDDIEIVKRIENHPFPTSRWESFYLMKK